MSKVFDHWQGSTLCLPASFCLADCEGLSSRQISFPADSVTIDAHRVEKADSIGIAALVLLIRKAREQEIELQWVNIGEHLRKMLAVYELDNGAFLSCRNN